MSNPRPPADQDNQPFLKRFAPVAAAIVTAALITGWLISRMPYSPPAPNETALTQLGEPAVSLKLDAGKTVSKGSSEGPSSARRDEAGLNDALTVEDRYVLATDLHRFHEEMVALGQAGDAEATYHAALALHECSLANVRTDNWSCGRSEQSQSEHVLRLCTQMQARCEGFGDLTADELTEMRELLYDDAAEAGYERGIARKLIDLSESDPDLALSVTSDLLATTDDFGTLFHIGRYLQNRLWRSHEGWIGGDWNEAAGRPGASAQWGQAAWQLAACGTGSGCAGDSIFMRSLCTSGNGCEPGWSYQDWLAYYRSPYEMEQINELSQTMRDALTNGDIDTIINQGAEGRSPP